MKNRADPWPCPRRPNRCLAWSGVILGTLGLQAVLLGAIVITHGGEGLMYPETPLPDLTIHRLMAVEAVAMLLSLPALDLVMPCSSRFVRLAVLIPLTLLFPVSLFLLQRAFAVLLLYPDPAPLQVLRAALDLDDLRIPLEMRWPFLPGILGVVLLLMAADLLRLAIRRDR